jgi:hypothetical protein
MKQNSLLIIGSGYYTLGDKQNFGCILSSIIQWLKENNIPYKDFKIDILVKKKSNIKNKIKLIQRHVTFFKRKINCNFVLLKKIKTNYDGCVIATPEQYHYFYSKIFLKKKIPIICVKPFGRNLSECEKILDFSKKYKTPIYIDFHKRFDKANLKIGEKISKNLDLNYQIIVNYSQPENIPNIKFAKWSHKTNPFQFLAPHYLDLINFWFQPKKFELFANAITRVEKSKKKYDAVSCLIKFKKNNKNVLVNINCNWMEPINYFQKSRQNIEIITNKFHIYSDQAYRGLSQISEIGYEEPNNYFTFFNKNNFSGYGYESFKSFFDKIFFNKEVNLIELKQHKFTSKVLEQINQKIK